MVCTLLHFSPPFTSWPEYVELQVTLYVAVNFEKNTYEKLTEKKMNHCIQRSPDASYIMNLPVYNLQNADAPCVAKLLGHQTAWPCTIKKTKCETD